MNSIKHAEISARRRGGVPADYLEIHQFIDSTKNLCSDNRHRIFHTMWAVNEIVLPLFGHQIINSDGIAVDVKDLCEKDHLLVDFRHRFIPTLSDFVQAMNIEITASQRHSIDQIHKTYTQTHIQTSNYSAQISRLLLSPLALTGQIKSLLITHNSWFLLSILPRLIEKMNSADDSTNHILPELTEDFEISGDIIFANMSFERWMNHGADYPPSARHIKQIHSNPI